MANKSVRPHFNILSKFKLAQDEENKTKKRFQSYNKNASMYKLFYADDKSNMHPNREKLEKLKAPRIQDKFPKLIKELNDP